MLDLNWKPDFGSIYTWFASDKNGQVAIFVNNNFGDIPKILLEINLLENKLDEISKFTLEESKKYEKYFFRKNGGTVLNFYSSTRYKNYSSTEDVDKEIQSRYQPEFITENTIPAYKGIYVYHAVEGDRPREDFPVELIEESSMGDYFKFLSPTIAANIYDFPSDLRKSIAKSEAIEFSNLKFIRTHDLNIIFDCTCD
jgi:hypothetical protein